MNFRTETNLPPASFSITHGDKIFMAGSCFAENISAKMKEMKFEVLSNPTGILFNPASIASMISTTADGRVYSPEDLHSACGRLFSWHHHGSFSGIREGDVLERMNRESAAGAQTLERAGTVIITFGSAWIYRLVSTGEVVANCHKQPGTLFTRHRLSVAEIKDSYGELMRGVLAGKNVIFTVSPVRHLKDGFAENSLSKAILRLAVGELCEQYPNAHYFPAFEIMNDDLRDYRFYGEDMVHPSSKAVEYIWEKFSGWVIDGHSRNLFPRLEKLASAMKHNVSDPSSRESRIFAENMLLLTGELKKELPHADFSAEQNYFSAFL